MTNGNSEVNVIMHPVSGEVENSGLTKREYFAAMRKEPMYGEVVLSESWARLINGTNQPDFNTIENINWWINAHEKFAVMKADALIEQLNKSS